MSFSADLFARYHSLVVFAAIFFTAVIFTWLARRIAVALNIVDRPVSVRKIHENSIPLLGGIAIFFAFFSGLWIMKDRLLSGNLEPGHFMGFFSGALILMIGGFLDDKYDLKPGKQIIFPALAALAVIAGGVGIEKITNPFGGLILLDAFKIPVFAYEGITHYFVLVSDLFVFFWLMGMMYTTKILDGLDGLVTGVTAIGSFIIFLFTMTTKYYQPDVGLAALILSAACLGFLVFNWHPAKIFLGEGGSLFLGYALGTLAIISGGKIAIALLILGIPIMDVVWAIIRRTRAGKNPFKFSDREHLHHRILDLGFGQRKTVLIYYFLSAAFGLSALFLQSRGKIVALAVLAMIMFLVVAGFGRLDSNVKIKNN
ncbi:MAG: MraY family glycosyltransferase [Patescibacteria group bacterium]|jgi:UDP-GlcNAc:undecaprenyl-phosphate GlcNAc-1-phosphate transferase